MNCEDLKNKLEMDFKEQVHSLNITPQKEVILTARDENYLDICQSLFSKPEYDFKHLSCLTAVDYIKENKITVVCHLWSYSQKCQLTVKLETNREQPRVPTVEKIWKSANWFEREVFDLYGVIFEGHSDLRRIMMPDDYKKFPLRKDFADDGFIVKPN